MLLEQENTNLGLEQCVAKLVGKLFPDDATIYVVEGDYNYFTNYSANPHVMLNLDKPVRSFMGYGTNFIIPTKNGKSLSAQLTTLAKSPVWRSYESTIGTFLILTTSAYVAEVFKVLWKFNIVNAFVVSEDDGSVYSSDPYSQMNNCGRRMEEYVMQNCSSDFTVKFLKPLRNHNQCPVFIYKKFPTIIAMVLIKFMEHLQQVLNVNVKLKTAPQTESGLKMVIENNILLKMFTAIDVIGGNLTFTDEMFRSDMVFVSPMEREVFTLSAIVNMFRYDVWILVIVAIITVSIAWGVILKVTQLQSVSDSFGKAFMNVLSLTICGCIRRMPQIAKLRCFFILYLFYVIIIQTAFKADLIKMLTSVVDSNEIKNMQDVANSKLPVCLPVSYKRFFNQSKPDDEIYTKIRNKLEVYKNFSINRTHCIHFTANVNFLMLLSKMGKSTVVVDDKFTNNQRLHLISNKSHHLMASINTAITQWKESGIYNHHVQQIMDEIQTVNDENNEPKVLTLEHLSGVFAILAFGLLLSLIVFVLEIVVYKIYN
ncbi:hypothetical protein RI129_013020 [Pyrocoelia pectoralis]|uniref:Ionotropic glutamate receptor C-terminal domain-containing protein n=1 Tax=Pyrocoelia pectoralis TaxID=417401 RepID=A0AAN7UV96_9COLE